MANESDVGRPDSDVGHCYLCGGDLVGALNDDHVPPKQIFAHRVRQLHDLQLTTLRVHRTCNSSYQLDEDYFVYALSPLASDTYAGHAVVRDQADRAAAGSRLGLLKTIRAEFETRPSGLVLPDGLIVKRLQRERIGRVSWKIVRGLYTQRTGGVLPESTPHQGSLSIPPFDPLPPLFHALNESPNHGRYPAVFDYRFSRFPEVDGLYLWALLFWDRIIVFMGHHDPDVATDGQGGTADVI